MCKQKRDLVDLLNYSSNERWSKKFFFISGDAYEFCEWDETLRGEILGINRLWGGLNPNKADEPKLDEEELRWVETPMKWVASQPNHDRKNILKMYDAVVNPVHLKEYLLYSETTKG